MRLPGRVDSHPIQSVDEIVKIIERIVRGSCWCGRLNQKQVNTIKAVIKLFLKKDLSPRMRSNARFIVNIAILHYQDHFEFPLNSISLNEHAWN